MLVHGESLVVPAFVLREPDYRLTWGSPAIDAGAAYDAPGSDRDGTPRPQGYACDIGAYEYAPLSARLFRRGDVNADGVSDISDSVSLLLALFGGVQAPRRCAMAADSNDDDRVDLSDVVRMLESLFGNRLPLPEPYAGCGPDPTPGTLGCADELPCR